MQFKNHAHLTDCLFIVILMLDKGYTQGLHAEHTVDSSRKHLGEHFFSFSSLISHLMHAYILSGPVFSTTI